MSIVSCPTLVIGVPVFNEAAHLYACLRSIQRQSYGSFKVIVVDNGSIDESPRIADYVCKRDSRFCLVRRATNGGASASFSQCIAESTSPLFCFVGAHDVLCEEYLAVHVRAMEQDPSLALSYTVFAYINEKGEGLGTMHEWQVPDETSAADCPWQRILWSVRSHNVGSGLFNGVMRRSFMPRPPLPAVTACDHLFVTKLLYHGRAQRHSGCLYNERIFASKTTGYMERITGIRGSRPSQLALYRHYMDWFGDLPDSPAKHMYAARFRWLVARKCALSTRLWGHVNGLRARLGFAQPIR